MNFFTIAHTPGTRIFRGAPTSGVLKAARAWLAKPRSRIALVSIGADNSTAVRLNINKAGRIVHIPCGFKTPKLP